MNPKIPVCIVRMTVWEKVLPIFTGQDFLQPLYVGGIASAAWNKVILYYLAKYG